MSKNKVYHLVKIDIIIDSDARKLNKVASHKVEMELIRLLDMEFRFGYNAGLDKERGYNHWIQKYSATVRINTDKTQRLCKPLLEFREQINLVPLNSLLIKEHTREVHYV